MNVIETIGTLRKRMNEFRIMNPSLHSSIIYDCCCVELAICFAELGLVRQREISKEEEHWFMGQRFIDETFRGWQEWRDIINLYNNLVEEVQKKKYFRN